MRLASVEVIPYALPFKEPYVTARGTLTRREMVLLRLRTDEGVEGLGEAVPLSLRGGATLEQVVRELEEARESEALHDLIAREDLEYSSREMLDPRLRLSPPALCAVLTALDDLWGRLCNDESSAMRVRCNATLVSGEPAAVAADALAWAQAGFSTFKLKVGGADDVAQVRTVREALGPEAKIRVDANAAWSLDQAKRVLAAIEPFDVELAEQPVANLAEAAELAQATTVPLAGDESIVTAADATLADELGAFAIAGIKLSKVGGYVASLDIAQVLRAYASSALDGPVGIAEGCRLAVDLDTENEVLGREPLAHGLATQRLFASTVAAVECELRDGFLHRPPGPGLGVEIDEDALQAHRL
jgi:muconate cycloisomerase